MNYVDFCVGGKEYKLVLTTRNIVTLESKLGCNVGAIFGLDEKNPRIPTVTDMVNILHAALQKYQHNITISDTYDIFDDYIAEGNEPNSFLETVIKIYQVSGILKGETEKN